MYLSRNRITWIKGLFYPVKERRTKNFLEDGDRKIQTELWDIVQLLKSSLKNRSLHISPVFNCPLQITYQSCLSCTPTDLTPSVPHPITWACKEFLSSPTTLPFFPPLFLALSQCSLQRSVLLYLLHHRASTPLAQYHLCRDIVLSPLPGRTLIKTRCLHDRYVLTDGRF